MITLNSLPCFAFEPEDADNKSHTMQAIGLLSLLVELRVRTIAAPELEVFTTAPASEQSHIADKVFALVNNVVKTAGAVLVSQSAVDPTTVRMFTPVHDHPYPLFHQVATTVQLLRLSNYLSRFILSNRIDYSALQVVGRWINEALKAAPPGFESIIVLAENLDGLVRLSSGWGFYDICNAFLTDITPPTDGQPLEILEKVSLINWNTGKETFGIRIVRCLRSSDLRGQAFRFTALCTLPAGLSGGEVKVVQDLQEKFRKVRFIRCIPVSGIEASHSSYPLLLASRLLRPLPRPSGLLN